LKNKKSSFPQKIFGFFSQPQFFLLITQFFYQLKKVFSDFQQCMGKTVKRIISCISKEKLFGIDLSFGQVQRFWHQRPHTVLRDQITMKAA
jgi:hypothetical protein